MAKRRKVRKARKPNLFSRVLSFLFPIVPLRMDSMYDTMQWQYRTTRSKYFYDTL